MEVDMWPALKTLVLTDPAPERSSLAGIVKRMPRLVDLRVFLAKPT
jgi:hypothetical protein